MCHCVTGHLVALQEGAGVQLLGAAELPLSEGGVAEQLGLLAGAPPVLLLAGPRVDQRAAVHRPAAPRQLLPRLLPRLRRHKLLYVSRGFLRLKIFHVTNK